VNVAAQKRDPKSLMDWTERMIRMRKEVPEIGWGDFAFTLPGQRVNYDTDWETPLDGIYE
jgi:hypothetical protein